MLDDTREEIHRSGYRRFVGGGGPFWDEIGELQYRFVLDHGLRPSDTFLDIACGGLRGGARFIAYLDPDRYLGIDKHIELIVYGVAELGLDVFAQKRPQFVVSDAFEFEKFNARPTVALAQSLFTHLNPADIARCLVNLRLVAASDCRLFATFFEVAEEIENREDSHSHGYFGYTRGQMEAFGARAGWRPEYIGDWGHPRDQKMIAFAL